MADLASRLHAPPYDLAMVMATHPLCASSVPVYVSVPRRASPRHAMRPLHDALLSTFHTYSRRGETNQHTNKQTNNQAQLRHRAACNYKTKP